jgi:nitrogen fixation/metabolism regulation signal transduction histidine kinase
MATNGGLNDPDLLAALGAADWSVALDAVSAADARLRASIIGDPGVEQVVAKLAVLADHPKWEVRRAVANAAAQAPHSAFDTVLTKLTRDDNNRVRQAAEQAALRRRDSRHASTLGKQHEDRINSVLDDIASRFGTKGRDAVRRAAEQIANTFARELYHEVIKLLSPLAVSAERLRTQVLDTAAPAEEVAAEAARIGRRITQLRAVLDAMRAYTAQPVLDYKQELLHEVIQEAAAVATENNPGRSGQPAIEIEVSSTVVVEVVRPRLVQALTNVMLNAIESYAASDSRMPIQVRAQRHEGLAVITIEDAGSGMSPEAQQDALTLFSTSKPNGTGFGLPLAVKIVESEHGGRLTIDSAKGRGTIVRIDLPTHRRMDAL